MSAAVIWRHVARLGLPPLAVFVVSVAYAIVLPVLPFMLARDLGEGARTAQAWHTGLLTSVYMLTLFLAAPIWGRVSARIGRRSVVGFGFAGLPSRYGCSRSEAGWRWRTRPARLPGFLPARYCLRYAPT